MNLTKKLLLITVAIVTYGLFSLFVFQELSTRQYSTSDLWGMFLFFLLLLIINSFPLNIKGTNLVLGNVVTLPIFLQFGLVAEALITQLAILFVLIRVQARGWHRYVANLTMFLLTSICSAVAFYALGGQTGTFSGQMSELPIVPILAYLVTAILLNHLLLYLIKKQLFGMDVPLLGKDFFWEIVTVVVMAPTGILIYILYSQFQGNSVFYVLIPTVTFVIIVRLYSRLQNVNEKLQVINETGHNMSVQLDIQHVVEEFIGAVHKLVPYEYCYLYRIDTSHQLLIPDTIVGGNLARDDREKFMGIKVALGDGLSGGVGLSGETKIVHTEEDNAHYHNEPSFLNSQNSILSVPLIQNDQVIGVLTLSHGEKNKYTKEDARLIEILANQAAIAFKNAYEYEETKRKSEMDELTNVYNYRYFEHYLNNKIDSIKNSRQSLSLIIIDIDHFKSVNDEYGHLAGNQILTKLAYIVNNAIGSKGIVARYGGEEFTILLPNVEQTAAYKQAEQLRELIEKHPFEITGDLHEDGISKKETIFITISVGVAVYPEHADDAISLIRHADRAMYIGAKRKGRNKVAVYQAG